MARGLAKGTLFIHTRQFVRAHGGNQAWAAIEELLPPADRALLDGLLLSGRWYPVGAWNRLLDSYVVHFHPTRTLDLARYTAAEDLSALFKRVLKLGSPELILRRAHALYARYFRPGRLEAVELSPRRWRLTLEAPGGEEAGPGMATCAYGIRGWLVEGLALTGIDGAAIEHERCRFRRARRCEYIATW